MKKILVVVDMQNDFITGPLGTPEAVSIVDKVVEKIRENGWDSVFVTYDTHEDGYLKTQEGRKLPVKHCIFNTEGWWLNDKVHEALVNPLYSWDCKQIGEFSKNTFGSLKLADCLHSIAYNETTAAEDIELTLVGVCTDICVISNALLLKAHYPEMKIVVDAACCAGTTPEKHRMTLEVMKSCQVDVVNDEYVRPRMTRTLSELIAMVEELNKLKGEE